MNGVVTANVASTVFLVGLIWTIQVVHYPLFAHVGEGTFPAYMADHQRRISRLILVPWAVQGLSSVVLAVAPPAGVPRWLVLGGLGLAGVTVLATVALAVPEHTRLSAGVDPDSLRRLVSTNWVRTTAWTAHAAVALTIAARAGR